MWALPWLLGALDAAFVEPLFSVGDTLVDQCWEKVQ